MYNGGPGGQLPPGQGAGGNPTGQPNNNLNAAAGGVPPAGAPAAAQQHHGMLYIFVLAFALHWLDTVGVCMQLVVAI